MNQNIQTLKGFRDFLPKEALKREWLRNKIIEVFQKWGYEPLETPTLEPLELFKGQIGEGEQMFFSFKDQGGRDVALRYDQTVPICRVIGQNIGSLTMPFRRYQIQPAFRAENPQKGRYREFLQCDADIFGVKSALADAEVIALSLAIYQALGFKEVKVLINDRNLLNDIPYEAIIAIDKLKKIGEEAVVAEMVKKGIENNKAGEYLNLVKNLRPNETIQTILNYLDNMGFPKNWYEFDPTIARSFAYSQGPIWEIVIPNWRNGSSVLGGERYDGLLAKISGQDIGGTGFGLGFDRTLEAAQELGLVPEFKTLTQILVTVFNPDFLPQSLNLATKLRQAGIITEVYPESQAKLSKQLQYASRRQIPYVVVIGDEEAQNQTVTLKDMKTGVQKTGGINELMLKLK